MDEHKWGGTRMTGHKMDTVVAMTMTTHGTSDFDSLICLCL
jgi:hypothetical protein